MNRIVVDTHVIIWYLMNSPRLSAFALATIDGAISAGGSVYIPSICLVEMIYLMEKNRIPKVALERLWGTLEQANSGLVVAPLDGTAAQAVARIPRDAVPDMPDRIIAATARHLGVPLVSRDRKIQVLGLQVVW